MKLFEEIKIGNTLLKNRMVMAAMTRARADQHGIVGAISVEYYEQRSGAGMILSEGVNISEQALGSPFTPGLFSSEQISAWKSVTAAVHNKGSKIYAQLWHTGRVGHSVDKKGMLPVAPSAVGISGMQHYTSKGMLDFEIPHKLSIPEIKQIIKDYTRAAENAIEAGFDGVQLHAANGYLPNQFLADSSNLRDDEYGGSIENKARFVLEVMEAIIGQIGGNRVGIKISPFQEYAGIMQDDAFKTYNYLLNELNKLDFAFVELMKKNRGADDERFSSVNEIEVFGKMIKQKVIGNGSFDKASAESEINIGVVDLISFGNLFLANPDLPERFKHNADLNQVDYSTVFGGGAKGYTDYKFMNK